jgi:hypothetical protein
MSDIILQIIGFACLGYLASDLMVTLDKEDHLPNKPFKCDMCLSYWISIIPFMVQFGLIGIIYAAMSAVTANILYKYI